ncbi:MAG: choice-of-anchor Q domain-containing protein, partial [Acidobacteriota bacterium]|nr:choice-of-anchor Q domain-containing protein [Acidobacteriota bacterium]
MRSLWLKTILLYVFPLCAFATPIQVCTTCPYTTIRDALEAATPGEVIEVADPIHTESGIIVKKDITLQGAPGTVIQAAASTAESNDRVIFVQEGSLTLRGLTIRHGKQENGGALYAAPGTIVTIEDCVFTDNEAKNYGAIDNRGQMTITRSTLSGNYGSSTNGALGNQPSGNLTLIDTRITDNSSQWFNGAVANFGTMTLERCTLARNADAMGDTGALTSSNGSMILTNCTISDNTGWAVRLISGTMTMNHVTLAQNGKGIEVKSGLTVTGSIFAENGTDMVINGGTVATNGMPNLCGDGSCPGFTIGNADLLPLTLEEDNLIHPLGDTSAAVDAYPGPCPETDQRGQARPQGTGCDLGAVEFVPSNAPPEIITASLPQATQFAPYQVTLEAMDPDGDALVFQLAEGPAGLVLDAATGMLTWVPDNQAGSHPVSVTVSDGVETVSREWLLEVTQANRPPTFTSTPNTTHLLIPAVGDAQPLIYSGYGASWQPVSFDGYVSGGSWSGPIAGDGTSITQTSNGNPGVWLSADELANGRFEGQIQVTAGSDDDYIGLVFGWQDARNFYLFDWKRGSQNEALAGMNLRRVRSNPRADTSPLP